MLLPSPIRPGLTATLRKAYGKLTETSQHAGEQKRGTSTNQQATRIAMKHECICFAPVPGVATRDDMGRRAVEGNGKRFANANSTKPAGMMRRTRAYRTPRAGLYMKQHVFVRFQRV